MQANSSVMQKQTIYIFFKRVVAEWLATDAPTLIYMAKATIAGLLALVVSMMLTLPDPRTAIFTSFIVMQPQSGLVFSKSYYRVLGTIAGVGMSLLMIGMFAQDPVWFIAFFAIWIGITTAAGLKYRNFQSYGFVLAGYTLCIVALPVIEHPLDIFHIATSRFSEVVVGILCATIISDILFPRKLSDSLLSSERERFNNILSTLAQDKAFFDTNEDGDTQENRFSSGVVGLQAIRINTVFESGADKKNRDYSQRLNQEYMNLSTTYHSLKNIIVAIEPHVSVEVMDALSSLYKPIGESLRKIPTIAVTMDDLHFIIDELSEVKSELEILLLKEQKRFKPSLDSDSYEMFLSAAHLIVRLLDELHTHSNTYLSFLKLRSSGEVSKELSRVVRFSTHTDNVLVALAAFRGAGVLLVTMMFWILTAWPYATLTITQAVVIGLLIGTLPSPLDAVVNFFKGAVAASLVAALYDFYIIPEYTIDILTLSLVLAPVLMFVGWMTTRPKWSGFSLGFVFLFMSQTSLDLHYKTDPTLFLETTLAALLGVVFAGVTYLLVNFWSCSLTQQRVAKLLRQQIVLLCSGPINTQRDSLESIGRDMVQQFSTHGRLNMRSSRLVFEWLLSTLEIGGAIITLRQNMKKLDSVYLIDKLERSINEIKNYFQNPSDTAKEKLLTILKEAIIALNKDEKSIVGLALIRTIILNQVSLPIVKEDRCP